MNILHHLLGEFGPGSRGLRAIIRTDVDTEVDRMMKERAAPRELSKRKMKKQQEKKR